jgi:hypothetical protein
MKDGDEVESAGADAIGYHVWSAGNNEFPRAGKPARPARMRLVHEPIDALDDLGNYSSQPLWDCCLLRCSREAR